MNKIYIIRQALKLTISTITRLGGKTIWLATATIKMRTNVIEYIHNGIICNYQKDETIQFAVTFMEIEAIILNKIRLIEDRYRLTQLYGRESK